MTEAELRQAVDEHRAYHSSLAVWQLYGKRETRAEYAARMHAYGESLVRYERLMKQLVHAPGPMLDALAVGTEEERDVTIKILLAATRRIREITDAG